MLKRILPKQASLYGSVQANPYNFQIGERARESRQVAPSLESFVTRRATLGWQGYKALRFACPGDKVFERRSVSALLSQPPICDSARNPPFCSCSR